MRTISAAERRSRLAVRHRLAEPAPGPLEAVRALIGMHSSDPVSVFVGLRARTRAVRPSDIERALYTDRRLARILGPRRTMFVVPVELAGTIHAGATRALAAGERARTGRMIADAGLSGDPGRWLESVERATLEALERRGEATAVELSKDVPELREQIPVGQGRKWEGSVGVSTRVLFLLANEGRIVRGRPRGSWTSTQYRWLPMHALGVDVDVMSTDDGRVRLARLWLERFGPGTVADLKWWTGWTLTVTRRVIATAGAVEVDLDGGTGYVLADDLDPVETPEPWVAFLPALDPTVMGWTHRDWFLGPHRPVLFDRNGNAGPTVWSAGRVVGGWAQRRDGEIAVRLLEDVGGDAAAAVETERDRLQAWLGQVRFIPRFRTPLERELSA